MATKRSIEKPVKEKANYNKIYSVTNKLSFDEIDLEKLVYLYKIATETEKWHKVFKSIKARIAPRINSQTKTVFSKKLNKNFRNHKYKPTLRKVVYIFKPNSNKRFLILASVKNKII